MNEEKPEIVTYKQYSRVRKIWRSHSLVEVASVKPKRNKTDKDDFLLVFFMSTYFLFYPKSLLLCNEISIYISSGQRIKWSMKIVYQLYCPDTQNVNTISGGFYSVHNDLNRSINLNAFRTTGT